MHNEPLFKYPAGCRVARLIRREKRFFVHALLDGRDVVAHTNNTGSMLGLLRPSAPLLLSPAQNPARRLKWTAEAVGMESGERFFWAGINTAVPNALLGELFRRELLPWAAGYSRLRREAACGESRIDGLITGEGLPDLWVECKNVTLVEDGAAAFPDAVTERGAKHLRTLERLCAEGSRAAMLYVIQRPDGKCFRAADYVDPAYAAALARAAGNGVEVHPLVVDVRGDGIYYGGEIPFRP